MGFGTDYPHEECIRRLRLTSVRYSQHPRIAKIHVASWLRIPFDKRPRDDEQTLMLDYVAGER